MINDLSEIQKIQNRQKMDLEVKMIQKVKKDQNRKMKNHQDRNESKTGSDVT